MFQFGLSTLASYQDLDRKYDTRKIIMPTTNDQIAISTIRCVKSTLQGKY
jgi:hypothetical protein